MTHMTYVTILNHSKAEVVIKRFDTEEPFDPEHRETNFRLTKLGAFNSDCNWQSSKEFPLKINTSTTGQIGDLFHKLKTQLCEIIDAKFQKYPKTKIGLGERRIVGEEEYEGFLFLDKHGVYNWNQYEETNVVTLQDFCTEDLQYILEYFDQ